VLTLLLSRVVTPSILRAKAAAGVPPGTPLPERSAELSRLLCPCCFKGLGDHGEIMGMR
jgi:hypothetical protein